MIAAAAPTRQPVEPFKPIVDPSAWTREQMSKTREWIHELSPAEIEDIDRAVARIEKDGIDVIDITRDNFAMPRLGPTLAALRKEVIFGRGFVLIRGVPIHRYTRLQSVIAYFGIGNHVGRVVSQNGKGHLVGHVKNITNASYYTNHEERGYRTNNLLRFHSDSCDMVGLLCLHPSKSGGLSSITSTTHAHNVMLERRPDLVKVLTEPFFWDRRGEVPPGKKPWYELAVFHYFDGRFNSRYGRIHIDSAQRFDEVPRLSEKQLEALDYMETLLAELRFDMEFRQGDIQLLHNHVILHSRTEYEDWPEPERRRHLLRLWLTYDGERPAPAAFAERLNGINTAGARPNVVLEAQ